MMSMNDPFRGVSAILGARKRRELPGAEQQLAAVCRPLRHAPIWSLCRPARPAGCVAARAEHNIVSGMAASPAKIGHLALLGALYAQLKRLAWFHVHGDRGFPPAATIPVSNG